MTRPRPHTGHRSIGDRPTIGDRLTSEVTEVTAVTDPSSPSGGSMGNALAALAELPPLIPVPTAARFLGLSRSAAYRYTASGELPTRHLGGRVYVVTALLAPLVSSADNTKKGAA